MRSALALLSVVLVTSTMPLTTADQATFTASAPCLVAGAQIAFAKLDGCTLTHEGTLSFVGCAESTCTFSVEVATVLTGAPVGAHEVLTRADDLADLVVVCSATDVSLETSLSCAATRTLAIDFGTDCRFVSIRSDAAANGRVAMATIVTSFSVCLTETGAEITLDS